MVSEFAFGQSLGALAHPEFKSLPVRVFREYLPSLHVIKAFPFVRWLNNLPLWISKYISETVVMGHELEQVRTCVFLDLIIILTMEIKIPCSEQQRGMAYKIFPVSLQTDLSPWL